MNKILLISILSIILFNVPQVLLGQDANESLPINIVITAPEGARIRRVGWSEFANLDIGTRLQPGDLIDPGADTVFIFCSDLTEEPVTQIGPVPCSIDRSILYQNEQPLAGWQRGANEDFTIPYIISPRMSSVLSATPVISWNPVQGVDGYRVFVRGNDFEWVTDIVSEENTELRYPDSAPPLEPGQRYAVEVVTITMGIPGQSSASEDVQDISFQIIDASDRAAIEDAVLKIHHTISDETIANYITAHFYLQEGLTSEAAELLLSITGDVLDDQRELGSDISRSPAIYMMLGDAFLQTQLEILAKASYANALEFATKNSSVEMQGLAALSLARILSDRERQSEFYAIALEQFEQLGAIEMIDTINHETKQQ